MKGGDSANDQCFKRVILTSVYKQKEGKTMKKVLLVVSALTVVSFLSSVIYAADFTKASLQGKFAVKVSASPRIVGMGVATIDENGNLTGTGTMNVPALLNRRLVGTVSIAATIEVNPDGTGTGSFTATYEDGSSEAGLADFVIMEAEVVDGVKLATEIFIVNRSSGLLGYPITYIYKRLPD
jgi:hypothetical protein